jgi:hypothetical protein
MVFESGVLRKIFRTKRDKIRDDDESYAYEISVDNKRLPKSLVPLTGSSTVHVIIITLLSLLSTFHDI